MNDIQNKIIEFFTNEKLLRAIRSVLIGIVVALLPIFYFGFKDQFTLDALFHIEVGVLVLIVAVSVLLATIETKLQCFELTCESDNELDKLHTDIKSNSKNIRKLDKNGKKSVKWLSLFNKEQQKLYNEILTNERIDELEEKALVNRIKGNEDKAKYFDKEIAKLKKKPLHDKTFVPYSIKKILNVDRNKYKFNRKKGNNEISINPKRINWTTQALGTLVRSSGIGIVGTIPFAVNEKLSTVVWFYVTYLLIIGLTIFTQWLLTAYITTHSYKVGLDKIVDIQELLLDHLGYIVEIPFSDLEEDYSEGEHNENKDTE